MSHVPVGCGQTVIYINESSAVLNMFLLGHKILNSKSLQQIGRDINTGTLILNSIHVQMKRIKMLNVNLGFNFGLVRFLSIFSCFWVGFPGFPGEITRTCSRTDSRASNQSIRTSKAICFTPLFAKLTHKFSYLHSASNL